MRKIRLFGSRRGATAVIVLLRPLLYRLKDVGPHSRTDFSPYLPVKGYINPVTAVLNQIERANGLPVSVALLFGIAKFRVMDLQSIKLHQFSFFGIGHIVAVACGLLAFMRQGANLFLI